MATKKKKKVVAKSKKPTVTTKKAVVKKSTKKPTEKKVKVVAKAAVQPAEEVQHEEMSYYGIVSPYSNKKYDDCLLQLNQLRRNGENKVNAIRNEIRDIKLNKQIDPESKKTLIADNKSSLVKAKEVASENRHAVRSVIANATSMSKSEYKAYRLAVKKRAKEEIANAKQLYREMALRFKEGHAIKLRSIKQKFLEAKHSVSGKQLAELKSNYKIDLKAEKNAYSAHMSEARAARDETIDTARRNKYGAFMDKYSFNAKLRNDKHSLLEWLQFKKEHYVVNFDLVNWLLKNALYLIIIIVFLALVGMSGGQLLTGPSILEALVEIAPKIFFSLGVAGLILLGGTDLSIGRLTGIGVSFSLMMLASQAYSDNYGVVWFNIVSAPGAVKVICAILISITFCTFFTAFAGFFTAKFKMHPFISTLAVQLISFGFFQLFWSGVSSFVADSTPGSTIDLIRGPSSALLIVYAAVAVLIIWFIWNKTRFGKHMYAVGGNQEAAVVSGINPFVITLSAFIMAGILYGFGGFVQALQVPTGNFTSGYGTETDAIAACVIGGISFSGGIGKVSGAVIGTIILGFLTFAFNFLSINANLQLLIKGVIILVAVALDCVKYLKKK